MEKIILLQIIGKGGFAREISCDNENCIMAEHDEIMSLDETTPTVIAIADVYVRQRLSKFNFNYENLITTDGGILGKVEMGRGNIICRGAILTTGITIGNHNQFNLQVSIGHDCKIGNFNTLAPKVSISGNCTIGNGVYIGTGAVIKEGIIICDDVIIGANSFVNRNITESGTYFGTPARKIK